MKSQSEPPIMSHCFHAFIGALRVNCINIGDLIRVYRLKINSGVLDLKVQSFDYEKIFILFFLNHMKFLRINERREVSVFVGFFIHQR
jgi:hypothetical protein